MVIINEVNSTRMHTLEHNPVEKSRFYKYLVEFLEIPGQKQPFWYLVIWLFGQTRPWFCHDSAIQNIFLHHQAAKCCKEPQASYSQVACDQNCHLQGNWQNFTRYHSLFFHWIDILQTSEHYPMLFRIQLVLWKNIFAVRVVPFYTIHGKFPG